MNRSLSRTGWAWSGWALALAATSVLLVAAVLPPLVEPAWAATLRAAFAPLCHQIAERSFHLAGEPLAVCHRCFGVYAGLVAGALALPLLYERVAWRRHERWLVLAAVAPAALDWGAHVAGVWTNTPASQALTGAWFGLVGGLLLARALAARRVEEPGAVRASASE